jgi:hypothetical protein
MAKAVFNVFADPRKEEFFNSEYLFTLHDVLIAISKGIDFKTNIMPEMSHCWECGNYQVYIVDYTGNEYEISNESNLTHKELRSTHNIYKMWRAGAFCDLTKNRDFRYGDIK